MLIESEMKDYYNRSKKDASYQRLIAKEKEVDPDAAWDTVMKKMSNLRSEYREEQESWNQECQVPVQTR